MSEEFAKDGSKAKYIVVALAALLFLLSNKAQVFT